MATKVKFYREKNALSINNANISTPNKKQLEKCLIDKLDEKANHIGEIYCEDLRFLQSIHKARHKIVIATARATDWHTQPKEVTLKWLADNKIPYDKIYIGRIDKEKICEEVNADFFIDDDLAVVGKVANYFASIGGNKQAFLSTTNYNKDLSVPSGVVRVKDFDDLAKRIDSKQICLE